MLEDLHSSGLRGCDYTEVPEITDTPAIDAPPDFEVNWLPRGDLAHGAQLLPALGRHLAEEPVTGENDPELVWDTPAGPAEGIYYWIAGESGVVKQLGRALVQGQGWAVGRWSSWGIGNWGSRCGADTPGSA